MVTIRYHVFDGTGRRVTKERTFQTEKQMQSWVARQERGNGNWGGVIAYSSPTQGNPN